MWHLDPPVESNTVRVTLGFFITEKVELNKVWFHRPVSKINPGTVLAAVRSVGSGHCENRYIIYCSLNSLLSLKALSTTSYVTKRKLKNLYLLCQRWCQETLISFFSFLVTATCNVILLNCVPDPSDKMSTESARTYLMLNPPPPKVVKAPLWINKRWRES